MKQDHGVQGQVCGSAIVCPLQRKEGDFVNCSMGDLQSLSFGIAMSL